MEPQRKSEAVTDHPRPLPAIVRWLFLLFACANVGLGILGIFIPGLPTTVFILMAAWAAGKSSPRLYRWLWNHRLFGPMLRNWANGGCVSRHAKWAATAVMSSSALILLLINTKRWAVAAAMACMVIVLIWLWRRPEP